MSYDVQIFDAVLSTTGSATVKHRKTSKVAAGTGCNGPVKLAQWWLSEFLTEKGSVKHKPDKGSTFVTKLRTRTIGAEVEIFAAFASAAADISDRIRSDEEATDSDSEKLAYVRLLSVGVVQGGLVLRVKMVTQAGEVQSLSVPIELSGA